MTTHAALSPHRRRLFGIAYRMTGSAADAEDVVQDTLLRALSFAPDEISPAWLTTVALNLARDRLRRRKRERYVGPWLPSPIDESDTMEPLTPEGPGTESRYELLESVSFAFLLALEALTPLQRAVLLLRDVFDYSARETADAVGSTEGAVKVQLLRARRKMAAYDGRRERADDATANDVLVRFLNAMRERDAAAIEGLLAERAELVTDGGGEFLAAGKVVRGPARIAKGLVGIAKNAPPLLGFELRRLNGTTFLVATQDSRTPKVARDFVLGVDVDAGGEIVAIYTILATRKLTAPAARRTPVDAAR